MDTSKFIKLKDKTPEEMKDWFGAGIDIAHKRMVDKHKDKLVTYPSPGVIPGELLTGESLLSEVERKSESKLWDKIASDYTSKLMLDIDKKILGDTKVEIINGVSIIHSDILATPPRWSGEIITHFNREHCKEILPVELNIGDCFLVYQKDTSYPTVPA